jgi:hypothetical protein
MKSEGGITSCVRRVVTRLSQVVNCGAAAINQSFLRVRALEVDLGAGSTSY